MTTGNRRIAQAGDNVTDLDTNRSHARASVRDGSASHDAVETCNPGAVDADPTGGWSASALELVEMVLFELGDYPEAERAVLTMLQEDCRINWDALENHADERDDELLAEAVRQGDVDPAQMAEVVRDVDTGLAAKIQRPSPAA